MPPRRSPRTAARPATPVAGTAADVSDVSDVTAGSIDAAAPAVPAPKPAKVAKAAKAAKPAPAVKAPAAPKTPKAAKAAKASKAPSPKQSAATEQPPAATQTALLAFLAGWREMQEGAITAGRPLVLHYEPARLADEGAVRDIVGFARFLPSGIVRHAVLRRPAEAPAETARVAAELPVPHETRHVELWFRGVDAAGASMWDSRFGANYRFEVVRPEPAPDALAVRSDAVIDPEAIHVARDGAVKENGFQSRPGYPSGMTSLRTSLRVGARVRPGAEVARAWVEVRGFDGDAAPVYSATLPLTPLTEEAPDGARFALVDLLYQGSVATPGSVSPRPDIRVVLYRLYGEVDGVTYTDGVVHRCELATDALSR